MSTNLGFILHHLSFLLNKVSDQVLQESLGIGFAQYKVLMALEDVHLMRQKEVANYLGQTEASISRQISLLSKKGLIKTALNPKSRREHLVALAAKGLRMLDKANQILNEYHYPMFEQLNPKKREKLSQYLLIMHETACQSPSCPLR